MHEVQSMAGAKRQAEFLETEKERKRNPNFLLCFVLFLSVNVHRLVARHQSTSLLQKWALRCETAALQRLFAKQCIVDVIVGSQSASLSFRIL